MELLKKILPYFFVLRIKNLFMVAANQAILSFLIIRQHIFEPNLSIELTVLLILDTLIITSGGYLINDIMDTKADIVNKPDQAYIDIQIPRTNAWLLYWLLQVLGFGIAVWVAFRIDQLPLALMFPAASGLLYWYSFRLKQTILVGNILVSFFVAMISGIVLFAERNSIYAAGPEPYKLILPVMGAYMIFSFSINLMREIVKDMEDRDGDLEAGYNTLPVAYGLKVSSSVFIFIGCAVVAILLYYIFFIAEHLDFRTRTFILLFCGSPLIITLKLIASEENKQIYSRISSILKWIMVAGLVSLIMIFSNF